MPHRIPNHALWQVSMQASEQEILARTRFHEIGDAMEVLTCIHGLLTDPDQLSDTSSILRGFYADLAFAALERQLPFMDLQFRKVGLTHHPCEKLSRLQIFATSYRRADAAIGRLIQLYREAETAGTTS